MSEVTEAQGISPPPRLSSTPSKPLREHPLTPGTRGSAVALLQSQQSTGSGLSTVLRPLLCLGSDELKVVRSLLPESGPQAPSAWEMSRSRAWGIQLHLSAISTGTFLNT